MPSKLRYILMNNAGSMYSGKRAINAMQQVIKWRVLEDKYPENWATLTKSERIKWLASMLPRKWKMVEIREPARTRKSRSKYVQLIAHFQKEGIPPELAFGPPKVDSEQFFVQLPPGPGDILYQYTMKKKVAPKKKPVPPPPVVPVPSVFDPIWEDDYPFNT